ncbi:MAG: hypothetical protein JWN88_1984 [Frankiales bacterium]|nr:hypothetical protein [Frankiales bacterium]
MRRPHPGGGGVPVVDPGLQRPTPEGAPVPYALRSDGRRSVDRSTRSSAARRERALLAVGAGCDEAIDRPADVLRAAAAAVAGELSAGCVVWLFDPTDAENVGQAAAAHPTEEVDALLRGFVGALSPSDEGLRRLREVLGWGPLHLEGRKRIAEVISRVAVLRDGAANLSATSLYAVPLSARGHELGLMLVARGNARIGADDRRLVDALAQRVALAVDNATLLAAARASRAQALALVEHSSDILLLTDRDGRVRYASPAGRMAFGQQVSTDLMQHVLEPYRASALEAWQAVMQTPGVSAPGEVKAVNGHGEVRRFWIIANNLLHDPAVEGVVITVRDVTEERQTNERLAMRAHQQAVLARVSATALSASLPELLVSAGTAVSELLPSTAAGILQRLHDGTWLVLGGSDSGSLGRQLGTTPVSGLTRLAETARPVLVRDYLEPGDVDAPEVFELYGMRSGVLVPVIVHGQVWGAVTAHSPRVDEWSTVEVDLLQTMATLLAAAVERAEAAARTLRQATTDALTGLPNRLHLLQLVTAALTSESGPRPLALLLLDLDDFKDVNDALGHGAGDQVLAQLGQRLRGVGGERTTVTRLGGDEFGLCISDFRDASAVTRIAEEVVGAVAEPFTLRGIEVTLSGSIGIALAPQDGEDVEQLLQAADMAMYRAKGERGGWALFDGGLDSQRAERLSLLAELRTALSAGQLELFYQPLVDLETERLVEVEALVRWHHPSRGLLLPEEFLPIVEQTDLVHSLTRYVVRAAARQGRTWRAQGWPGTVAVNISALALRPAGGISELREELLRADGTLTVELTESALVDERARRAVERLAAAGIRCSIDDFGTGYSALSYLQTLPVSRLKLDRAFNRDVDLDERDAAIVGGVVALAHSIGLDVVAEGVETAAVAERLRALSVDVAQGWLYGQAVPATELRLPELG